MTDPAAEIRAYVDDVRSAIPELQAFLRDVRSFTADLRAQGIHVGFGSPPVCVVDDERWPCSKVVVPGST